ncbi:hypothetical protein ELI41_23335 [Rhizobium leguminosarum]|uniref:hypothetical protein n=1 Tax=Rhizobium leguminosarum TaxID=384 RepID=UPI0010317B8C|nr:hypothetical protein [Rhizobium leguminosarum]TAU91259.1 hypothetical protein ELI41_23335 [Rhizobium leguminosarum]
MKPVYTAIFALACLSSPAASRSGISVEGTLNCAQWAEARKVRASNVYETYVLGLLNGLSVGSGTEFWFARGAELKREQVFYWMDVYCQAHPLSEVFTGAVTLMNENTGNEYSRRVNAQPE